MHFEIQDSAKEEQEVWDSCCSRCRMERERYKQSRHPREFELKRAKTEGDPADWFHVHEVPKKPRPRRSSVHTRKIKARMRHRASDSGQLEHHDLGHELSESLDDRGTTSNKEKIQGNQLQQQLHSSVIDDGEGDEEDDDEDGDDVEEDEDEEEEEEDEDLRQVVGPSNEQKMLISQPSGRIEPSTRRNSLNFVSFWTRTFTGSLKGIVQGDENSTINPFSLRSDSIRDAMKRLTRQPSQSSEFWILSRPFSSQTSSSAKQANLSSDNSKEIECDIRIKRCDSKELEKTVEIDETPLCLGLDRSFASRHRQSIAVQTFFTKSIAEDDDHEEDEDENLVNIDFVERHSLPSEASGSDLGKRHKLGLGGSTSGDQSDPDVDARVNNESMCSFGEDSTTSGWTAPTATSEAANQSMAKRLDRKDRKRNAYMSNESFISESLQYRSAPAGLVEVSSSGARCKTWEQNVQQNEMLARGSNKANDHKFGYNPSQRDEKERPDDKTNMASKPSGTNKSSSCDNSNQAAPSNSTMDQINSDFSSFTLNDTTTSKEISDPIAQIIGNINQSQRRAFSETEVMVACDHLHESDLLERAGTALANIEILPGEGISGTGNTMRIPGLTNLNQIRQDHEAKLSLVASPFQTLRQIKSAEATRQQSSRSSSNNDNPEGETANELDKKQTSRVARAATTSGTHFQPHHRYTQRQGAMRQSLGAISPHTRSVIYQQDPQMIAGSSAAKERSRGSFNQVGKVVSYNNHHRQWTNSNTFSSSQNSDVSLSQRDLGTNTNSDKDCSRRTSTLSGISSIYQQETSLSLSTPANTAQTSQPSGMGSIPELTSVDQHKPRSFESENVESPHRYSSRFAHLSRSASVSMDQQRKHLIASSMPLEIDPSSSDRRLRSGETGDDSELINCESGQNPQVGRSNPKSQIQTEPQQSLFQSIPEPQISSLNLQRVAQSLRTQLRDRLPFMRPFMSNRTQLLQGSNGTNTTIQEESSEIGVSQSVDIEGQPQTILSPLPSAASCITVTSRATSGQISSSREGGTSATPTSQPSFRSFFRNTGTAAFSAFASSFQSSSTATSTPTASTVIAAYPNAGSNMGIMGDQSVLGRHTSGSVSSDVFDGPSNSPSISFAAGHPIGTSTSEQASIGEDQIQTRGMRSPISSPISSRFFAQLRDKFVLTMPSSSSGNLQSGNGKEQLENRPEVLEEMPGESQSSIGSVNSNEARDSDVHQYDKKNQGSLDNPTTDATTDLTSTTTTNNSGTLSSVNESSTSTSSEQRARLTDQKPLECIQNEGNLVDELQRTMGYDFGELDHHYDQVVALRRPSFQRQLDEQVNQVYRMAVDRKLHNMQSDLLPIAKDFVVNETGSRQAGTSDLSSIIRPIGSLYDPTDLPSGSIYLPNNASSSGIVPRSEGVSPIGSRNTSYTTGPSPSMYQQRQDARGIGTRGGLDSSQQSIDSSSSARSLRSCWFSMPELYTMDWESSTQSPIGGPKGAPIVMDNVDELLFGAQAQSVPGVDVTSELIEKTLQRNWPSHQLYEQIAKESGSQNWTLSDLNLTSNDIEMKQALPASKLTPPLGLSEPIEVLQKATPGLAIGELVKASTLDDSICVSIKSSSSNTSKDKVLDLSRPTSQNSTLSNASGELSDLNVEMQDKNQNICTETSTSRVECPTPKIVTPVIEDSTELKEMNIRAASTDSLEASSVTKQRAMSLIPMQRCSSPTNSNDLKVGSSMISGINRRRSTATNLNRDNIAPAAATLELRMAGRNRNRVKLTDLHPITFINDHRFLQSMESLKKGQDTDKLNAILNSPVGRRLSIHADMAAQQNPIKGQTGKSAIKIGLTGYVYFDQPKQRRGNSGEDYQTRRPSLAPNVWLATPKSPSRKSSVGKDSPGGAGQTELNQPSRPRASSCTPAMSAASYEDQREMRNLTRLTRSRSPMNEVSSTHPQSSYMQRESLTIPEHYNVDRRRSTISLLGRLSESSIELEGELGGQSPSEQSKEEKEEMREEIPLHDPSKESSQTPHKTVTEAKRSSSSSETSSDDGDIDKLVAQYPVIGHQIEQHQYRQKLEARLSRLRFDRVSNQFPNWQHRDPDRVVKNETILKQLMMATNAVSLNSTDSFGERAERLHGSRGLPIGSRRRFSAINLYQRENDVFVANSMKRAPQLVNPENADQLLSVLPILTGALPIIPKSPEPKSPEPDTRSVYAPLSGVKSIITGSSGVSSSFQVGPKGSRNQSDTKKAFKCGLDVEDVDVEEQLNRLRQQERHSFALTFKSNVDTKCSQSLSSQAAIPCLPPVAEWPPPPITTTDEEQDFEEEANEDEEMAQVEMSESETEPELEAPIERLIPIEPARIPAITQTPGSMDRQTESENEDLERAADEDDFFRLDSRKSSREETMTVKRRSLVSDISLANKQASPSNSSKSPPHSPHSPVANDTQTTGSPPHISPPTGIANPQHRDSRADSVGLKQLDTIIEGRGLSIGEQAGSTYSAGQIRRLSGSTRRASLSGTLQPQPIQYPANVVDWCRCDLSPSHGRRRIMRSKQRPNKVKSSSQESSQNTLTSSSSGGFGSPSKFVFDTVKTLARKTLSNLTSISGSRSNSVEGETHYVDRNRTSDGIAPTERSSRTGSGLLSFVPSNAFSFLSARNDEPKQDDQISSSCETESADSISSISLVDAENFHAKIRESEMRDGKSLESLSAASLTDSELELDTKDITGERDEPELDHAAKMGSDKIVRNEKEGDEDEDENGDEDEEEEVSQPKICYKCNKRICEGDPLADLVEMDEDHEPKTYGVFSPGLRKWSQRSSGIRRGLFGMACDLSPRSANQETGIRSPGSNKSGASSETAGLNEHSCNQQADQQNEPGDLSNPRKLRFIGRYRRSPLVPRLARQRSFSANYTPVSRIRKP